MRGLLSLSLLCLLAVPGAALAAPGEAETALTASQRALSALRYPEALSLAADGIAAGDADPATLAALYRVQGEATAVLGDVVAAEEAFARFLQLTPGASLPADASPKLRRPFDKAREHRTEGRFRLVSTSRPLAEDWVQTEVVVEHDTHRLVQTLSLVRFDGAEPPLHAAGRTLSWRCPAAPCRHAIEARDVHGNVVARAGSAASPLLVERGAAPTAPQTGGARPLWRQPAAHLVGAGLLAVTGGVLAWRFTEAQGRLQDAVTQPGRMTFAQAQALDAERRALHPWMWGSFAGAAALTGTALWVW